MHKITELFKVGVKLQDSVFVTGCVTQHVEYDDYDDDPNTGLNVQHLHK